jgi:predicted PhzF superfamily epimerase YddE/YHI9
MSYTLWVADAFTRQPFKGNPAGVCFVDDFPNDQYMLQLSAKLGFSNSAFVKQLNGNKFQIRWFTPHSEAPICGHATLATSHILYENGHIQQNEEIVFESPSGNLFVNKTGSWYNLNFPAYLDVEERIFNDKLFELIKIRPVFNGFYNKGLFMEFASEEEVRNLNPDLEFLKTFKCRALTITAKAKEGSEYDFISRYFAPSVGINEDPVCASAHCALIPYWSNKLGKKDLLAYQASKRGGVIKCKDLGDRVIISGEAVTVFKGSTIDQNLEKIRFAA